jgi:hypothetical protein
LIRTIILSIERVVDVHDPGNPEEASGPDYSATLEAVDRVLAWYNQKLVTEQRAAAPDVERMEQLRAERTRCAAERRLLDDADPQELAPLEAFYESRFRELTQ